MKKRLAFTYVFYFCMTLGPWYADSIFSFDESQILWLNFVFTVLTIVPIWIWNRDVLQPRLFRPTMLAGLDGLVVLWIFFRSFANVPNGVVLFFIALVNVALVEEIIFRGIFYSSFLAMDSPVRASVLTSVLFTAMHLPRIWFQNEIWFVSLGCLFALSLFLCLIFYWSRNVLLAGIMHFFMNYFLFSNLFVLIMVFHVVYLLVLKKWKARKEAV